MSHAKIDTSHISAYGGSAELWIDGKKTPPIFYALSDIPAAKAWKDCSQRAIRNFGKLGIHIVCVDTNLHEGWATDGTYDPLALYRDIEAVLRANPHAKIITRLHLNPPYHWLRKHPKEAIRYLTVTEKDGEWDVQEPPLTDNGQYGDRTIARKHLPFEIRASIASQKWIEDVCAVLKQLCLKIKEHPLGDALIGIQVAYGHCGEWAAYAESDFGEPMRKLYCRMAKEKYKTTEELQRFYGNSADFETLALPTPQEIKSTFGSDPDHVLLPEKHARIIDFLRSYSRASTEAISRFCACIKENAGEGMLAGAFYGYFFYTGAARSAHFEPERIFSDKNVDFLAAPCAYTENKKSGNMNMLRYVAESCRLNGKLMLCEMDQGFRSVNQTAKELYVCENEQEYSALIIRNIMENVLLGNGAWYYDHRIVPSSIYEKEEYWDTPERLETIGKLQKVCEALANAPYRKTTDVLLVVDAASKYYAQNGFRHGFELIDAIGKSGVGFDRLFLSDLTKVDLDRYRCVLFVDCPVLSQDTYQYIQKKILSSAKTTVIMGRFAVVVDEKENDAATFILQNTHKNRVIVSKECITDPLVYREIFKKAGAHIYTDQSEVVIADNGLVMVHCKDIPRSVLHLHCGDIVVENPKYSTAVYNTQTGERIL